VRRAARYADGLNVHDIAGDVDAAKASFDIMLEAWQEYSRSGRPRLIAGFFYALGPDGHQELKEYFDDYYEYGGPAIEAMISGVTTYSIAAVKEKLARFEAIGCDLVLLTPVTGSLDELDRVTAVLS
jgi:hypothetical protein